MMHNHQRLRTKYGRSCSASSFDATAPIQRRPAALHVGRRGRMSLEMRLNTQCMVSGSSVGWSAASLSASSSFSDPDPSSLPSDAWCSSWHGINAEGEGRCT